jgi:hypothetical protein
MSFSAVAATEIEGTFRVNGANRRMRELQAIFETPPRVRASPLFLSFPADAVQYGKSLDWKDEKFTTHDVASVFRRYLTQMPVRARRACLAAPARPADPRRRSPLYPSICIMTCVPPASGPAIRAAHPRAAVPKCPRYAYRAPRAGGAGLTRAAAKEPHTQEEVIAAYKRLIHAMPRANQYLLLYVLDLLSVFARRADKNRMDASSASAAPACPRPLTRAQTWR